MQIKNNVSLKSYNTFGIDVNAKFLCEVSSINDLKKALLLENYPSKFIISGGSNMLLTKEIDALVIHINLKGITIISEDKDYVTLKVMAGENWHDMIIWTLNQGYGGLENMSLIPGNSGTAPIQNIGAYGVELKDNFISCEAMNIANQTLKVFSKQECNFGYRDSYFKNEGKGTFIITSITLRLTKNNHNINTSYGSIQEELDKKGIENPTPKNVSDAVIAIRESKLPNPKILGNSGSFFKNPVLTKPAFDAFIEANENAPFYKISENEYKVPAGWLIEQCGYKGKRFNDAGVHKKQALVLVNYGNATGQEILNLAHSIINDVNKKFKIEITPEVNIIK